MIPQMSFKAITSLLEVRIFRGESHKQFLNFVKNAQIRAKRARITGPYQNFDKTIAATLGYTFRRLTNLHSTLFLTSNWIDNVFEDGGRES